LLNWTYSQVTSIPVEVSLLCEHLGWTGPSGFDRLQNAPRHAIRDWLVIAEMEKEREKKRGN